MKQSSRKLKKWKSQGIQRSYTEKRSRQEKQIQKDIEIDSQTITDNLNIAIIDEEEGIYEKIN